jgi:hypothetical protein
MPSVLKPGANRASLQDPETRRHLSNQKSALHGRLDLQELDVVQAAQVLVRQLEMRDVNMKIGNKEFSSKKEAKDFIRTIFSRHQDDQPITGSDSEFLHDLIQLHPEASSKVGCGVSHFTTRVDPVWKNGRHFVLFRTDGSSTDFSFISCIDGKNRQKDAIKALRNAVYDQTMNFKMNAYSGEALPVCPYLNVPIEYSDAHVDHVSPITFKSLVESWLAESGISIDGIVVSPSSDNQWKTEMIDEEQRASWAGFHQRRASLRIIHKTANLSHARKDTGR